MPNISGAYTGHTHALQAAAEGSPSPTLHGTGASSTNPPENQGITRRNSQTSSQRRGSGSTSQESLIRSLHSEEVLAVMSPELRQSLRDNPRFHQVMRDGEPYYHNMNEQDVLSAFNTIKENIKEIAEMGASHTAQLPNVMRMADFLSHALDPTYMVQVGGRLATQHLLLTTLREHAATMRTGVLKIDPEVRSMHRYVIVFQAVITAYQLQQAISQLPTRYMHAQTLITLTLRIFAAVNNTKHLKEAISLRQGLTSIDEKAAALAKLEYISDVNYIKELDYVDEAVRQMEAGEANTLADRMNADATPKLIAEFYLGMLSILVYMYFVMEKHKSSHDAQA